VVQMEIAGVGGVSEGGYRDKVMVGQHGTEVYSENILPGHDFFQQLRDLQGGIRVAHCLAAGCKRQKKLDARPGRGAFSQGHAGFVQ
jgi:hypothetical protein